MKPYVLLCTGGIGSGKSFVAGVFNALGVPSYDCDSRVKTLYDTVPGLAERISDALGGGYVDGNGLLDRRKLASRVFSDRAALDAVENLVYPALAADFGQWKIGQSASVVIIESAILLEKPSLQSIPDGVVTVSAPEDVRMARVMERDDSTMDQVLERMANQIPEQERLKKTDYTIWNDGRQPLLPQILNILKDIEEKNGKNRS